MTARPVLYSFRRCPYAMRARMAMLVSGCDFEHREVVLRDKPTAMLAVSPKATVPVLVLADGAVIDESIDIMRWALAGNDPEKWLARGDEDLVAAFDDAFKHHLDLYKYATRHDSDPAVHRAAGLAMLILLDTQLAGQSYLGGAARGFADVAIFPFVRQFAGADAAWFDAQPIAHVQRWLADLTGSALFARAMVRHEKWVETAA